MIDDTASEDYSERSSMSCDYGSDVTDSGECSERSSTTNSSRSNLEAQEYSEQEDCEDTSEVNCNSEKLSPNSNGSTFNENILERLKAPHAGTHLKRSRTTSLMCRNLQGFRHETWDVPRLRLIYHLSHSSVA